VREYKAPGYDGWANKTGYFRKRFSEEHAFGMLIAKYGDEVTSRTPKMARKDILSRLILHNLHAFLYHRSLSQKELPLTLIGWGWSHNAKKPKRLLSDPPI